jgi:hypothetical protein
MSMTLVALAAALAASRAAGENEPAACAPAQAAVTFIMDYKFHHLPIVMDVETPDFSSERRDESAKQAAISVAAGFRRVVRYQVPARAPAREKAPPQTETIKALWIKRDSDPRITCPTFKGFASGLGLQFVDKQREEQLRKLGADGYYQAVFVQLTTPVMNAAQTEGLAFFSDYAGPLGGGTSLLLIRKGTNGDWRVVQQLPMSIS